MQTQYKYGGTLAVRESNLMKKIIDTLGSSENSNKLTELLFVIAEKTVETGQDMED